jgi:hypothetical protein
MTRSIFRRAAVPSLFALAALTACVVNLDFTYAITGQAVHAVETTNTINSAVAIDLTKQSDIQAHKSNIQSISLNAVDMTVSAVQTDSTIETVTGSLSLRPDGGATDGSQDVLVGALTAFPITQGSSIHLVGSPALDAFALATVKGSGLCSAIIKGSTTGGLTADFAVDLKMSISMAYDAGL